MINPCESCKVSDIDGQGERPPFSVAFSTASHMWRRDWGKGETIDDHNYRGHIASEAGVTFDEAEVIWNCARSQYRGECSPTIEA